MPRVLINKKLPRDRVLSSGESIQIRLVLPKDYQALASFLDCLPWWEGIRLGWDIPRPRRLEGRLDAPASEQVTYRIATLGDQRISLGSLSHAKEGPCRWVGDVSIVTDPYYRDQGIGPLLLGEFLEVAKELKLEKLVVRLVADKRSGGMEAARHGKRIRLTVLRNHYYDSSGAGHDLVLLEMPWGRLLGNKGEKEP